MKVKQRDKRWITELIISCISCQCNMKYISSQSTYPSKWNKNESRSRFLIQPHSLSNFEIQRYYQNKATFTYVYSRNNLPKIKERVYIIIQEKQKSIGTHCIALYVNGDNRTYFDSFGDDNRYIKTYIFRIRPIDPKMW